jgi:hypothetical protein
MRRSLFLHALLVVLVSAVCWAQRGGGSRMGGGRHIGGGFVSHGGMRAFGGAHFSGPHHAGFHGSGFVHAPHRGPVIVTRGRFGDHRFGHRRFYPNYPLYNWYGYSYWPSWDYDDAEYDARFGNNYDDRYQTAAEINRLSNEVERLRDEREYTQAAAQPAPAPVPQPSVHAKAQEDLPVVVVFLDKHIREVKNYAVANEMLVVLDGSKRTKIPLGDIDLAATMKLNDERGVDFQIPNPVMSQ